MPAELGQASDPKALIPGAPDAILEKVRVLGARAEDSIRAGEALKQIDTGAWTGEASDRFHDERRTEVPRWLKAGDSLNAARRALETFAECLSWAQGQAAEAIELWKQGEEATRRAQTAHDQAVADAQARTQANAGRGDPTVVQAPAFSDPGEAQRQAARDMLERARQQLADVGDRTADALSTEAVLAPQDSQKQADANFYGGIWNSIAGFGEGLTTLISDPAGTVSAMAYSVTHPVETFKAAVAWDDWANGRGDRALGKITGDVLVSAATLGVGKVAKTLLRKPPPKPPAAVRPSVTDPKLNNIVNALYKGIDHPERTGDGTTADAVRHERATNEDVQGKNHERKARESIRALNNWLRKNPNASEADRQIAQAEIDNLRDALGQ
ncbi:putative T7SS-secreted protein [Saccharopolyspora hattusasensis]|uniref:putative T7SS-secreted protein n=1 Tax=Saccharopolyspora hattusasensis TaxID=1128679 RepID=UPI003D9692B1